MTQIKPLFSPRLSFSLTLLLLLAMIFYHLNYLSVGVIDLEEGGDIRGLVSGLFPILARISLWTLVSL